jgi:hypothetical protein
MKFSCHYSKRIEPTPSGLKVRTTLAWGKAPGTRPATIRGLKARVKSLIPNKPLIEGNTVLRIHRPHLGLKISPFVMGSLRINVSHQCEAISQPDGERRIAPLPAELRKLRALRLDPLGRRDLQSLDHSRNRFGPRKEECDVNVIADTANTNADIFRSIEDRGQVGVHLGPDCIIQEWTSILGAKHQMRKNVRKRLGHDGKYNASFQPANLTSPLSWGVAPGYKISGLQHASLHAFAALANDMAAPKARTPFRLNKNNLSIRTIQNAEPASELKASTKCLVRNLCIAAALLLLICAVSISHAQSPPLHIKIINAQTNKPIHDEKLNVALRVDQIGSVAMATDKNGIIAIDYGKATIIRILSNMYADCRPRLELYTNYSIDTIVKNGITTGNLCSDAQAKAKPGELILYEIPKTYIPTMTNPPANPQQNPPNR